MADRRHEAENLLRLPPRFDPFFINYQVLLLAGLWYINSTRWWVRFLYGGYRFTCILGFTMTSTVQVIDVYLLLVASEYDKLIEHLCSIVVSMYLTIKIHISLYKAKKLERLQMKFDRFRRGRSHSKYAKIWKDAAINIATAMKWYYFLGVSCLTLWVVYPALDDSNQRNLPFPWVFPYDIYRSPYYEIVYTYQAMALYFYLIGTVSLDVGYISFLEQTLAEYDVLRLDLKDLMKEDDPEGPEIRGKGDEAGTLAKLKECIRVHQEILMNVDETEALYSTFLFWHVSLASVVVVMLALNIALSKRISFVKLSQRFGYVAVAMFNPFLMCLWGTKLKEKSYTLGYELSCLPWYRFDAESNRILKFMVMRAMKVPVLKPWKLITLDLPNFLNVIRLTYNSVAVVKNSKITQ